MSEQFEVPKIESQQKLKNFEPAKEKEFSPEVMEMIMAKVQDINKKGTAFTHINIDSPAVLGGGRSNLNGGNLTKIFREGLLGCSCFTWGDTEITKENWLKNLRSKKGGNVFFNIVGRMESRPNFPNPTIKDSPWRNFRNQDIFIIFDLSSFKERTELDRNKRGRELMPSKSQTYRAMDNLGFKDIQFNEEGESMVDSAEGFALSHRLPPRYFRGIVGCYVLI